MLVRLSRVKPEMLRDLLGMAHGYVTRRVPRKRGAIRLDGDHDGPPAASS